MDDLNSVSNERISALMDGDLHPDECAQLLVTGPADAQTSATWHTYHVIGDVLRSPELAPKRDDLAFWQKIEQRLAQEPVRPSASSVADGLTMQHDAATATANTSRSVANASLFRWKLLAGVACTALVSVVGSVLWTPTSPHGSVELSAANPALSAASDAVAIETSAGAMLRDARLDELMDAHRQMGGHSAFQLPTGFLRNTTFEGTGR